MGVDLHAKTARPRLGLPPPPGMLLKKTARLFGFKPEVVVGDPATSVPVRPEATGGHVPALGSCTQAESVHTTCTKALFDTDRDLQ